MLRRVVSQKLAEVLEVLNTFVVRAMSYDEGRRRL
jgi:hypothetical protein